MNRGDDLQDTRTRPEHRRDTENAHRPRTFRWRWLVIHPVKATIYERVMAFLGAIILLAYLAALLLDHLGILPNTR
jgi:hypothetical protein